MALSMFRVYLPGIKTTRQLTSTPSRTISLSATRTTATVLNVGPNYSCSHRLVSRISSLSNCNKSNPNREVVRHFTRRKIPARPASCVELPEKFKMEWPKITLFGDSITRRSTDPDAGCWASHIHAKVGTYFDVDVRGFEGYNSKWALELMPKLFPKSYLDKVEVFIPFFGHNDSWEGPSPLHVPLEQYEANMRAIVKYLLDNGLEKRKILMITPTWYHQESFLKWLKSMGLPPTEKKFQSAKLYSDTVLKIAKSEQIDVVDFFDFSTKFQPLEELFCDGVHYSRLGAKQLFDHLMPIIEKKIEVSFKKPLGQLNHTPPWDQVPEVKKWIELYMKQFQHLKAEDLQPKRS